jgi:hypothetical protein
LSGFAKISYSCLLNVVRCLQTIGLSAGITQLPLADEDIARYLEEVTNIQGAGTSALTLALGMERELSEGELTLSS